MPTRGGPGDELFHGSALFLIQDFVGRLSAITHRFQIDLDAPPQSDEIEGQRAGSRLANVSFDILRQQAVGSGGDCIQDHRVDILTIMRRVLVVRYVVKESLILETKHVQIRQSPGLLGKVALDLNADGPDCFIMEPPGYLLHRWVNGDLVTHTCAVGSFAGPYRFREGGALID